MNYSDVVRDFAQRTRQNLKVIEELSKAQQPEDAPEVFEVTQLINSMLGLLVFPQQQYFDRIPRTPLATLAREGWPIPRVHGDFEQVSDLHQLMRYLRNAIAHFNIEFISNRSGHITGIRVWNIPNKQLKNWEAELEICELRGIVERFIKLLLEED